MTKQQTGKQMNPFELHQCSPEEIKGIMDLLGVIAELKGEPAPRIEDLPTVFVPDKKH